jgi:hypothetical protein
VGVAKLISKDTLTFLKRGLHAAFGLLLIFLIYVSGVRFYANDTTPVVGTQTLTGSIETVQMLPINPKMLVHRSVSYRYGVRLDDGGAFILTSDPASRSIGSRVVVERKRHQDGFDDYRILSE